MKDIRIATVVFNSSAGKTKHNLDRMEGWIKEAKKQGAAIICFPEMNITGYLIDEDLKNTSEPIPGPITRDLLQLAASANIVILAGMAESDSRGNIFASHVVVKPGKDVSVYRKPHLSPPECHLFTPGNDVPLFEAEGVKFGIQLCYDAHFPELATCMAVNGADIIFIPHASPNGTPEEKFRSWMRHLPARAYDNSLFIVACNQCGENEKGLNFPGLAVIIGPSGEVIDKDLSGQEALIVTDLMADDLEMVRNHRMRFFLPNRRPELY